MKSPLAVYKPACCVGTGSLPLAWFAGCHANESLLCGQDKRQPVLSREPASRQFHDRDGGWGLDFTPPSVLSMPTSWGSRSFLAMMVFILWHESGRTQLAELRSHRKRALHWRGTEMWMFGFSWEAAWGQASTAKPKQGGQSRNVSSSLPPCLPSFLPSFFYSFLPSFPSCLPSSIPFFLPPSLSLFPFLLLLFLPPPSLPIFLPSYPTS
jgi:hypothetical protein